ncbi:hypothetical protein JR316_0004250 [Psilocybe cubensis]|uniref:Uncharacterized protein n=2 Tax=Psilocybe cubensis TaxID=181762 RepID=A0A8H8CL56_PSICU|nr:hypothetical protein JR316_0004250 [Psilocybe cubensis]KAH9482155.1 hypothetical protein JR316_0004250 [Psilocybe cubensis]
MTSQSVSSPLIEQATFVHEAKPLVLKPSNRRPQRAVRTKKPLKVSVRQKGINKRTKASNIMPKDDTSKAVRIAVVVVNYLDTDPEFKDKSQQQTHLLSRISNLSKEIRACTKGLKDDSWIIYNALILLLRLKVNKPGQQLGDGLDLFFTAYILSFKYLAAGYEELRWTLESWKILTGSRHELKEMAKMDLAMCKDLNWNLGSQTKLQEFRKKIEIDYDKGLEVSIESYI